MKTSTILLFASILLLACLPEAPAQDAASAQLVVIDLRPEEEKQGFGKSPLNGKCNEDVFRIADVASDPLKVDVLKADLAEHFGLVGGGGGTLTVLNWSIYYNKQVQVRGGGPSSVGIGGYTIPGAKKEKRPGSKCSRKESAGGWYEGNEVKAQYFPLISEFQGTFGGKPVSVRIVHSPRAKIEGKFEGGADDTQELLDTVHETVEAVVTAISQ